jgi:hypothetical protein
MSSVQLFLEPTQPNISPTPLDIQQLAEQFISMGMKEGQNQTLGNRTTNTRPSYGRNHPKWSQTILNGGSHNANRLNYIR